jgi:DNA invertase Pin-like site-specific DNA recombinase
MMQHKTDEDFTAFYVRVSSLKDSQKDSPEHQISLCLEKAKMEELTVRPELIYEDRSTGTSIMTREEIKRLIADAEKGYFKTIIFASLSRFSRDSHDAISLKRTFVNALGIRLISIEDVYDSKIKDDELVFTIISAVNQKLSEQISISSRRGIRESAKKGNYTGSRAPFGYKKIRIDGKKTLKIVEQDAEIINEIFSHYVNDNMGEKQIVRYLNESKELPSPKGGVWGITTIQRILQNEAYTGRNVFGKYTVKKVYKDISNLQNRQNVLVQKEKDKWEKNDGLNWEPIIDEELFKRAQEIRLERGGGARGGIRKVSVNPFSGLLKCPHCGSNYVSVKSGKVGRNGQEYRYLICSSRRRMGTKGCKNGLWLNLEEFKIKCLNKLKTRLSDFLNSSYAEHVISNINIPNKTESASSEKKQKNIQDEINMIRNQLFQLRKEFKLGDVDRQQYEFEKERYEEEIKKLQNKLNQIVEIKPEIYNEEKIKSEVRSMYHLLLTLDYNNFEDVRYVLKKTIREIIVDENERVEISDFWEF